MDFYLHFIASGDVFGAGLGSQPGAWAAALGDDRVENRSRKRLSWSYGFLSVDFARQYGAWVCDWIALSVRDLPEIAPPQRLSDTYGEFAPRVPFHELERGLTAKGLAVSLRPGAGELAQYLVPAAQSHIWVVADPAFAAAEGRDVGDVWSINRASG